MRKELSKKNIKVLTDEQVDLVVYYKIVCRGYEERFGIVRDIMRSEISVRLTKYINEASKAIDEYGK